MYPRERSDQRTNSIDMSSKMTTQNWPIRFINLEVVGVQSKNSFGGVVGSKNEGYMWQEVKITN